MLPALVVSPQQASEEETGTCWGPVSSLPLPGVLALAPPASVAPPSKADSPHSVGVFASSCGLAQALCLGLGNCWYQNQPATRRSCLCQLSSAVISLPHDLSPLSPGSLRGRSSSASKQDRILFSPDFVFALVRTLVCYKLFHRSCEGNLP